MEVGQTYKIKTEQTEDDKDNKSKKKYILAKLLKEFNHFLLFQTKNYKTTIHKEDYRSNLTLIQEA